jgi:hypothetical protein
MPGLGTYYTLAGMRNLRREATRTIQFTTTKRMRSIPPKGWSSSVCPISATLLTTRRVRQAVDVSWRWRHRCTAYSRSRRSVQNVSTSMTIIYSRMTLKNRFCLREKARVKQLDPGDDFNDQVKGERIVGSENFLVTRHTISDPSPFGSTTKAKTSNSTMKGGNAVLALLFALSTQYASAVTFQFVAEFNENCTAATIDQIAASNDAILAPFFQSPDGDGYQFVEPGGVAEDTAAADTGVTAADAGSVRHRELLDCPSKCSNSNSNTCRLLGCAKCGDSCDRRLWQAVSSPHYRYWSKSRAGGVTSKINPTFSKYVGSRNKSCKAWLAIYQINADGSTTLLN